jgi:hypothetical protein
VKAVDGADIDAIGVLALDAALGDDVGHSRSPVGAKFPAPLKKEKL